MRLLISLSTIFLLSIAANTLAQQSVTPSSVSDVDVVIPSLEDNTLELSKIWGLTLEEFDRYRQLNIVDKSFAAPNITPYEVLGKYAKSSAERQKYAILFHDRYVDNQVRTLEWLVAISNVGKQKDFSGLAVYDSSRGIQEYLSRGDFKRDVLISTTPSYHEPYSSNISSFATEERLKLFLPYVCGKSCTQSATSLLEKQNDGSVGPVDIIFADRTSEQTDIAYISRWAHSVRISPQTVKQRIITLNFESDKYKEIRGDRKLPVAINSIGIEVTL